MKTTKEHESGITKKQLFCQLFHLQRSLDACVDTSDPDVQLLLTTIDRLLERLLNAPAE